MFEIVGVGYELGEFRRAIESRLGMPTTTNERGDLLDGLRTW